MVRTGDQRETPAELKQLGQSNREKASLTYSQATIIRPVLITKRHGLKFVQRCEETSLR